MEKSTLQELVEQLEYAKKAVIYCLENESGNVDWHGLKYWAEVVEKLRKEIKERI